MSNPSNENILLKIGCILVIAGGAISQGIGALNSLSLMNQQLNGQSYSELDQMIQQQTGGQMDADQALNLLAGVSIGSAIFCLVVFVVLLMISLLGLKRISDPKKYRYFLIWGVLLLLFGGIGALTASDLLSVRGLANLVWGIAGPVLFLVGAIQQRKSL